MYRYQEQSYISLWPCWPPGGCYHLLCAGCGTANDGCRNHQKPINCRYWQPEWGIRRWNGYSHNYANTANTAVTAVTADAIPTSGDVSPQQFDNICPLP